MPLDIKSIPALRDFIIENIDAYLNTGTRDEDFLLNIVRQIRKHEFHVLSGLTCEIQDRGYNGEYRTYLFPNVTLNSRFNAQENLDYLNSALDENGLCIDDVRTMYQFHHLFDACYFRPTNKETREFTMHGSYYAHVLIKFIHWLVTGEFDNTIRSQDFDIEPAATGFDFEIEHFTVKKYKNGKVTIRCNDEICNDLYRVQMGIIEHLLTIHARYKTFLNKTYSI